MYIQKQSKKSIELIRKAREKQMEESVYFCKICGSSFKPKSPRSQYCSEKCRKHGKSIWRKQSYVKLPENIRLLKQKQRNERRVIQRDKLKQHIIKFKQKRKCQFCGERDYRCLQFHHINPKEKVANITEFVKMGCLIKKLQKELNKCIVLCANCHSKLHYKERGLQHDKL